MSSPPKAFISYSQDSPAHAGRVRALADRLHGDGVDCTIDQYEPHPKEPWPRWMDRQIEEADFVLVVCTETYLRRAEGREKPGSGLGVTFESVLIIQDLYDDGMRNEKFIPVLFEDTSARSIPKPLRGYNRYRVDTEDGYELLLRHLRNEPKVRKPEIQPGRPLPEGPGGGGGDSPTEEEDVVARVERRLRSLDAEQTRENRRVSLEAIQAFKREREAVNARLVDVVSNLNASNPGSLRGRDINGIYTVGTGDVEVAFFRQDHSLSWHGPIGTIIRSARLILFMNKEPLVFGWTDEVAQVVAEYEFEPGEDDETWRWLEIGKGLRYSSIELADHAVERLIDEHERRRKAALQRKRENTER